MMPPTNPDDLDLDLEMELELRQALKRIEPGKDFSVLSYAQRRWPGGWAPFRRLLALAAAMILMISLSVGVVQYQARQQRREEARAELIQALQFTQSKLQRTRQMVARQLDRRNTL
jgi:hypothetical protein